MKAITLHPEWIIPILSDRREAKRTENRMWQLPRSAVDVPIALHSGARIGGSNGWRPGDSVMVRSRFGGDRPDVLSARAARGCAAVQVMMETAKDAGWPIMDRWRAQIAADGNAAATDDQARVVAQLHAIARMCHPGHVVGVVWFSGCDREPRTPWDVRAEGSWCWRISQVTPLLQPIPCKGAEQLWMLPDDVRDAVVAQLRDGKVS